jgi:hypothetical protein
LVAIDAVATRVDLARDDIAGHERKIRERLIFSGDHQDMLKRHVGGAHADAHFA